MCPKILQWWHIGINLCVCPFGLLSYPIIDRFSAKVLTFEVVITFLMAYLFWPWRLHLVGEIFTFSSYVAFADIFGAYFDILAAIFGVDTYLASLSLWYLFPIICAPRILSSFDFFEVKCWRDKLVLSKSDLRVLILVSNFM